MVPTRPNETPSDLKARLKEYEIPARRLWEKNQARDKRLERGTHYENRSWKGDRENRFRADRDWKDDRDGRDSRAGREDRRDRRNEGRRDTRRPWREDDDRRSRPLAEDPSGNSTNRREGRDSKDAGERERPDRFRRRGGDNDRRGGKLNRDFSGKDKPRGNYMAEHASDTMSEESLSPYSDEEDDPPRPESRSPSPIPKNR